MTDAVPLFRAPESWPLPLVAAAAMLALAGLDFAGALLAKEWSLGRAWASPAAAGVFVLLAWVYASSLRYADLATVTFGWIVLLQVGLLLLDRFRYDVVLPPGKWTAVVVILVAQAYLVLAPSGEQARAASPAPAARSAHAVSPAVVVGR